jgi:signal transduction histidine kinase
MAPPRRTVRLRLTLFYGGVLLVSGAALLATTYVLVRFTFPAGSVHTYTSTRLPADARPGHPLAPLPSPASLRAQAARQRSVDLHQLLVVSGLALVVMALVSVVLGWLVAGRVLRPLRTITARVQDISATNLHRRLALAGPDDELKELGDTFDALLGRLQQSFQSQRQFVANASHELRTPLTLERALLEAALSDPDSTAVSLRGTCARLLVANTRQTRLIEALLTLATSERGVERWDTVELAEVTEEVLAPRNADAIRRGLRVEAALKPAPVAGDAELVSRLVANLVDNALRHNVADGWIRVVTGEQDGGPTLSVSNSGPPVPGDDVDELFQPFRRAGNSRTRHTDGHGLGLSIVAAVAAAHHAVLTAHAHPKGGLTVIVRFRTAPASSRSTA